MACQDNGVSHPSACMTVNIPTKAGPLDCQTLCGTVTITEPNGSEQKQTVDFMFMNETHVVKKNPLSDLLADMHCPDSFLLMFTGGLFEHPVSMTVEEFPCHIRIPGRDGITLAFGIECQHCYWRHRDVLAITRD